ncbi:hypothetical protein WJX77_005229 [Trebouxia sp. C0004]
MTSIQPESFDLVVIGTGLEESLIAASASRSGKTVLHLDQADSYGSAWSSLNMDQFLVWEDQTSSSTAMPPVRQQTGLQESASTTAADAAGADLLRVPVTHEQAQIYSNTQLHQQPVELGSSREFSLDLAGKVVFCASDTIDTMLSFGVQNYLEFKLLQGSYIYTDGNLASVPASRAAVFRDKTLGPMDKRLLTRFLMQLGNSLHDNPFPQAAPHQPLVTLLRSQNLSLLMRQFIMYAVAMADSDQESLITDQSAPPSSQLQATQASSQPQPPVVAQPSPASEASQSAPAASPTEHQPAAEELAAAASASTSGMITVEQGVQALRQYLRSVGQHGPSSGAFLTPMYGCAELPQAFCRVAAVHGAVYVLRQPIDSLLLDPETYHCRGIQTDTGQVVRCSALAASAAALHSLLNLSQSATTIKQQPASSTPACRISRAICVLDGPIQEGESELLIIIPPNMPLLHNPYAIRAIQLGPAAAVCPGNRHLLYLSTPSTAATAAEDLSDAVSALVQTETVFASTSTRDSTPSPSAANANPSEQKQRPARDCPEALLVAFFNQQCQQENDDGQALPSNVACCFPPDGSIDVDSAVRHAKQAFGKLFPDSVSAFDTHAAGNDDNESDDEALDALGDVLQSLGCDSEL